MCLIQSIGLNFWLPCKRSSVLVQVFLRYKLLKNSNFDTYWHSVDTFWHNFICSKWLHLSHWILCSSLISKIVTLIFPLPSDDRKQLDFSTVFCHIRVGSDGPMRLAMTKHSKFLLFSVIRRQSCLCFGPKTDKIGPWLPRYALLPVSWRHNGQWSKFVMYILVTAVAFGLIQKRSRLAPWLRRYTFVQGEEPWRFYDAHVTQCKKVPNL